MANYGEREERGAEGVRLEEGVSPSPPGRDLGRRRLAPSPEKLLIFELKMAKFWCILEASVIAVELPVLHAF